MIRAGSRLLAAVVALATSACSAGTPASPPPPAEPAQLRVGVNVHFAQGWPQVLWPAIGAVHAGTVREALGWRRVEAVPGQYAFTAQNSGHVARLCAMKLPVVLVIDPRHPDYDGGMTADSATAQAAFGAFVAAVADRFGPCLAAIEVGNEINGARAMTGPAAANRADSHVRLMQAVWQAVKPGHPGTALLGGSVNTVGTGFLEPLFAAGLLNWVDGVAVHPYRRTPEGLDWELAGLRAAMARHGAVKPVWATEFGVEPDDPAVVPDYLVRMAVLMSASGIHEAQWYALADDAAFPTMGLMRNNAAPKPAAAAFANLATNLLSHGPALRLNRGEPSLYRYRFGPDREVIWGASRSITVPAGAVVRNSAGERIAAPSRIGPSPILIESPQEARLGPREVLADSLLDYAGPAWAYAATGPAGIPAELRAVNSRFATSLGSPKTGQMLVNPQGMILPARAGPVAASLDYTMKQAGRVVVQACLVPKAAGNGTAELALSGGPQPVLSQPVGPGGLRLSREIDAAAGDRIGFTTTARGGLTVLAYRFRVVLAGTPAAGEALTCS